MNYKEFMSITKTLDRNKYHTCCSLLPDMETCEWVIFRKNMPLDEYWSSENKPILDSKVNSKEELIEFCEVLNIE